MIGFVFVLFYLQMIQSQNGDESMGFPNYPSRVFHVLFNIARMSPIEYGLKYGIYYNGFGDEMKASLSM